MSLLGYGNARFYNHYELSAFPPIGLCRFKLKVINQAIQ
ncbi:hypothetical protein L581_2727 [Serratia fonticola AU-AP2C]|nr:hypothetical protein L581_2727 [Serratia fonticola AU-AP2C]